MEIISSTVRSVIIGQIRDQVLSALIKKYAFFALPIVNPLAAWLVNKVVVIGLEKTILGMNILWIEVDNKREHQKFVKSFNKLKAIDETTTGEDEEKIIEDFRKTAHDLIRIRSSRL